MSAARRYLPADPAELARSLVPIGLLVVAAAIPFVRIPVLIAVAAGAGVAIARDAPVRWTWAAAVPVALGLVWGTLPAPEAALDGSDCANPASPVATWRALEAVVVLAALAALAFVLKASPGSLWLRWPARRWVRFAVIGFLVTGPVGLDRRPVLRAAVLRRRGLRARGRARSCRRSCSRSRTGSWRS